MSLLIATHNMGFSPVDLFMVGHCWPGAVQRLGVDDRH
jgi:hypothetical protein